MSIVKGFASIIGGKIGVFLISTVTMPLLIRFLGSGLYGDYAFLLSVLSVAMIFVNAGISDGTRKYISEDRKNSMWVAQVFRFYLRTGVFLAFIVALAFVVFSWLGLADRFFGASFVCYFYLLGLLIVVRQANSIARSGLMGIGLENRSEPLNVLRRFFFMTSALSLLYLGYGVGGVLVGHVLGTTFSAAIAYVFFFKRVNIRFVLARIPDNFQKKKLLLFNSLSTVLILLTASLYHVDIILLRLIKGDQATGYYRAALVVAEFLWFVPMALQTILLHSSSTLWSKDRGNEITDLSSRITRYNLSFVLLPAIGLAVLSGDLLPLYFGSEFETSIKPLLSLLPGVIGFAIARPIFAIGQGKGNLRPLIKATGTAALVNLILNALLIPIYGSLGAAIATSIGYSLMVVLHIFSARQIGFDPIQDLRLARIGTVATITSVIIIIIAILIESSIVSLIIVPLLGSIIYSVLIFRFGVITFDEVEPFTGRLPNNIQEYVEFMLQIVE